jgi:poly-gamma-glutamate synthesis protein (capsule biosynthesis protein)
MFLALLLFLSTSLLAEPITLTFAGDTCLGQNIVMSGKSFEWSWSLHQKDPSWYLRNIKPVFDKSDLNIVNLEGPIVEGLIYRKWTEEELWLGGDGKLPGQNPDDEFFLTGGVFKNNKLIEQALPKRFRFKGKPEYLEILKQGGVNMVSFANNHTLDYGYEGYKQTVANLEKAGIPYCLTTTSKIVTIKGKTIAFVSLEYSYNGFVFNCKNIKADYKILLMHFGNENRYRHNTSQEKLAHLYIDRYGFDLVIGHHPHVVQDIEIYKGKTIVYSLGNFVFGGNRNPNDKEAILYQITFDGDKYSDKIIPILVSGEQGYNDYAPRLK